MSESTDRVGDAALPADLPADKPGWRRHLKAAVAALTDADRAARSAAATEVVAALPEWGAARVVLLYLPLRGEVDTRALTLRAWQAGKTVAVPRCDWDRRRLLPVELTSLGDGALTPGGHGLLEPLGTPAVYVGGIDLALVPGLGFDAAGTRLGRGMGFYDRFLAQPDFTGLACGLGFAAQLVPDPARLPAEPLDAPMDLIATDAGVGARAGARRRARPTPPLATERRPGRCGIKRPADARPDRRRPCPAAERPPRAASPSPSPCAPDWASATSP